MMEIIYRSIALAGGVALPPTVRILPLRKRESGRATAWLRYAAARAGRLLAAFGSALAAAGARLCAAAEAPAASGCRSAG